MFGLFFFFYETGSHNEDQAAGLELRDPGCARVLERLLMDVQPCHYRNLGLKVSRREVEA